jgi:hypothetical protein
MTLGGSQILIERVFVPYLPSVLLKSLKFCLLEKKKVVAVHFQNSKN